jgi:hypothetical protein
VCECGERLSAELQCRCGRGYELTDGRLEPLPAAETA